MKALAKTARVNQAIQVIQLMNDGMTVTDACQEVGLPRSSYYDIVNHHPEALTDVQEMLHRNAQEQLGMILANKTNLLQKIIDDGLSEATSPRDRVLIFNTLSELDQKLSHAIETERAAATYNLEFLHKGVPLSKQPSRVSPYTSSE